MAVWDNCGFSYNCKKKYRDPVYLSSSFHRVSNHSFFQSVASCKTTVCCSNQHGNIGTVKLKGPSLQCLSCYPVVTPSPHFLLLCLYFSVLFLLSVFWMVLFSTKDYIELMKILKRKRCRRRGWMCARGQLKPSLELEKGVWSRRKERKWITLMSWS